MPRGRTALGLLTFTAAVTAFAAAAQATTPATSVATPVCVFGIPVDFILFALTLIGVGFFVMLAILGWNPDAAHRKRVELPSTQITLGTG